jgi:hypothetical protein
MGTAEFNFQTVTYTKVNLGKERWTVGEYSHQLMAIYIKVSSEMALSTVMESFLVLMVFHTMKGHGPIIKKMGNEEWL